MNQENKNQNHNEIIHNIHYDGYNQKDKQTISASKDVVSFIIDKPKYPSTVEWITKCGIAIQ